MKPARGYYSLIQYCPDLGRLEAANIGVLLFCPEKGFLKALVNRRNERIRRFFGKQGHDWSHLNALKNGLVDRIERERGNIGDLKDLREFIALRANRVQITDPRPMKVTNPDKDLKRLFDEILGPRRSTEKQQALQELMNASFESAGDLQSKIQQDITVKVPVLDEICKSHSDIETGDSI